MIADAGLPADLPFDPEGMSEPGFKVFTRRISITAALPAVHGLPAVIMMSKAHTHASGLFLC